MIVLLAALEEEVSGLRRWMSLAPEAAAGLGDSAYTGQYRGKPVVLVVTGMGRQRAEEGVDAALARFPVTAVISIGFSGALARELRVGDLVLASELMGLTGSGGDEIEPTIYQADQELLRTAEQTLQTTPLRVVSGPTVTAPDIIATPAAKQDMGRQTGAVAVDIESYWIARAISDRGLPFLALRAISDTQEESLLPFHGILDEEGNPRARRLAAHLIRKPGSLVALARLARNASRARRALTTGVACVVAAL
jgi:adenosylhomocysteine nucleosidase